MGLLLLLPLSAIAEEPQIENDEVITYWASKPIQCSTPEEVAKLAAKYGESPTIILDGSTGFPNGMITASKFVIAYNPKSETWTLIEFSGEDQACILGSGKGNISFGKKGTTT